MKYNKWSEPVNDYVKNQDEAFTLSLMARELGMKKYGKTYKSISSAHYQLMKLVTEGRLNKVGTYYVPRRIGWTALKGLMSYARSFIKKFENYGVSLFNNTIKHTKRFYFAALKLVSG